MTPAEKICLALIAARQLRPYYGRGLAALTPVAGVTETVAVDRHWRLYYSEAWVESTPLEQLATVLAAHEVEHLLRDHHARQIANGASPFAWNVAADAEVNDDLVAGEVLPDGAITPQALGQPEGLLAEEYLSTLPEPDKRQCCGGGSGAGRLIPGELEPDAAPGVTDSAKLIEQVAADVLAHEASQPGTVPAGVLVWAGVVASAMAPVTDWRRELAANVRRAVAAAARGSQDYSWRRLSRRGLATGTLLPATVRPVPRVAFVADTSGSMQDHAGDVLAVLRQVTRAAKVTVYACDTEVVRVRRGEFFGGGGTDLRTALARAVADGAHVVVTVTDGETPWPHTAPAAKIITVLVGGGSPPPFGKTIKIRKRHEKNPT